MFASFVVSSALAVMAGAQEIPQVKLPPSPQGQAAVQVGGTWEKTENGGQRYRDGKWIVVDYSRPLLRGRTNIFGSGSEYGQMVKAGSTVWRAGANATTTLTTQVPLVVGGKTVPPGVYGVVVDLKPGDWTLILTSQERQQQFDPNEKTKLYGGTNYDPKFDVARVKMNVGSLDQRLEQFTIAFCDVTDGSMRLVMAWENTAAVAPIEFATK